MKYLRKLAEIGPDIAPIQAELAAHPELWNEFTLRTGYEGTPHGVDDVWVRYRAWSEWEGIKLLQQHQPYQVGETHDDCTQLTREPYNEADAIAQFVGTEHESVWYPGSDQLPCLKSFIFEAMRYWECERLGGVLITRIPPGAEVKWHQDAGWHAGYYTKLALQIKSASGQAFCFEDGEFQCEPGTVYAFDNSVPHRVINPTQQERITLIMCVRLDQRKPPLWHSA